MSAVSPTAWGELANDFVAQPETGLIFGEARAEPEFADVLGMEVQLDAGLQDQPLGQQLVELGLQVRRRITCVAHK